MSRESTIVRPKLPLDDKSPRVQPFVNRALTYHELFLFSDRSIKAAQGDPEPLREYQSNALICGFHRTLLGRGEHKTEFPNNLVALGFNLKANTPSEYLEDLHRRSMHHFMYNFMRIKMYTFSNDVRKILLAKEESKVGTAVGEGKGAVPARQPVKRALKNTRRPKRW
ncbi:hypothetical protein ONZ45_g4435 [Pleurotus djamor]|nr:hypothetical protein ONZ45_g4435 [Pleurotus djamor]